MKRTSLSLILVFSLLGTPVPAKASNGMADMMSIMMEMFLWMMRSGGSGGFNRFNNIGGPGGMGYPSGLGYGMPYYNQGMYSPLAYPGLSPYSSPYGGAYGSPYNRDYYGNQPFYRQGYNNPYYPNYYNANSPYTRPYRRDPYRRPGVYNRYGPGTKSPSQKAPVVIQPIIVSPTQQATSNQTGTDEPKPGISVETLPPIYSPPVKAEPEFSGYGYSDMQRDYDRPVDYNQTMDYGNSLHGRWEGINGEYLEMGRDRFRMRSNDAELQGTYQLKNSILKAAIPDRTEPVYLQYRMDDGHLMFVSEDGQKMLFRRLP